VRGQGFITEPFPEDLLIAYARIFLKQKKVFDEFGKKVEWQNRVISMGIHDLNNLLFAVSSNLELAILEGSVEGNVEKRIERSLFTLRNVVHMVQKFQEMLRLGSLEFQLKTVRVDMRKLLERTVLMLEVEMQLKNLSWKGKEKGQGDRPFFLSDGNREAGRRHLDRVTLEGTK
jgi:hypothetical protein